MIVCDRYKFVYIGPPKTASSSLHRWLSQPAFSDERWRPAVGGQHSSVIPDRAADYFCFASVRHPFDRVVSLWQHSQRDGKIFHVPDLTFPQFVAMVPQLPWIYRTCQADILNGVRLDGLVRFDQLPETLLALDPIAVVAKSETLETIPHRNRTQHGPWRDVVTEDLRPMVRKLYRPDFRMWRNL